MIENKRYNLVRIIYDDLYFHGKMQLFLLFLIIISAILIVWITYQTRYMISNREDFFAKKHSLECEWNNLILEREILSSHIRIERIALNKLHMYYFDPVLKNTEIEN